jgi:UDP-N-acetylglucosamine 1-carboxyvinyltransferase
MQPTLNFKIQGGKKLSGTIEVNSSKNGAVALLCASLINRGTTTLEHMPKIEEVNRIIEVLLSIGVKAAWKDNSVVITPPEVFQLEKIDKVAAEKTRSILMFTGALIHTLPRFSLPQAGGCKLGSRTVRPHLYALEKFGVNIETTDDAWEVASGELESAEVVMYESGDTATINALLGAAGIQGQSTIKYASANYQVQDVCFFLQALGVEIEGVGTTTLTVRGKKNIKQDVSFAINEDPTDAMFFLAAAIVTNSRITIERCPIDFLELELLKLEKMNFNYTILKRYKGRGGKVNLADIETLPSTLVASPEKIYGRPYPGLNIDNLPFFAVIATQAQGTTLIHDWAYEKRALYYTELDKLGATTLLADPHRIFVTGPTPLHAADLTCPPALRPATILLIAMLAAPGESILRNIYSINRGYEGLASKLSSLGASVEMVEDNS